jgi:hypothetical protein
VDGLSLSFDYATPVVDGAIEEDALTEQVVAGLVTLTRDDRSPLPKEIHTTTPSWESLAESAWKTWDDPMLDRLTRTMNTGRLKQATTQVEAAALTLISGKSYTRKSADQIWPQAPAARRAHSDIQAEADLRQDIVALLYGRRPAAIHAPLALRFTAAETNPRLRSGTETTDITPLIEGLAFAGQTVLLPDQKDVDGRRGFTWALNPVPMRWRGLVDVHETRTAPSNWTRFTLRVLPIPGGTKASRFGPTRTVPA